MHPGEILRASRVLLFAFNAGKTNNHKGKRMNKIFDLFFLTVNDYIPTQEREIDKPFLIAIEDVFTLNYRTWNHRVKREEVF
jgi:translation elongation factor EF-Tu-like GTPase